MQEKSMMRAEKERLRLAEKEEKLKMVARMREEAALRRKDELEKRRAEREKEKEVRCDVLCCDVFTPSQTPFVCQQCDEDFLYSPLFFLVCFASSRNPCPCIDTDSNLSIDTDPSHRLAQTLALIQAPTIMYTDPSHRLDSQRVP